MTTMTLRRGPFPKYWRVTIDPAWQYLSQKSCFHSYQSSTLTVTESGTYFIFSMYLPAATQLHEYFRNENELLFDVVAVYEEIGLVIVMHNSNVKINGSRLSCSDNISTILCRLLMKEHDLFQLILGLFLLWSKWNLSVLWWRTLVVYRSHINELIFERQGESSRCFEHSFLQSIGPSS